MSKTPVEIEAEFEYLRTQLTAVQQELARLDEEWVRAKGRYQRRWAESFIGSEGAMDVRKQKAILLCDDDWLSCEIAEQKVRATKERLRVLGIQAELTRSISASIARSMAVA